MKRENCWEVKNCGRKPGGEKVEELGVCPSAIDKEYDGVNNGQAGGRICWGISGTFCGGKVQGTFARKLINCLKCQFFQQVQDEEGRFFILQPSKALKENKGE